MTVLDFGLAKTLQANATQLTQEGRICGTPIYMAPEVWTNEYGGIGPPTDIYALGCIMFEMLTGRPVFSTAKVTPRRRSCPQSLGWKVLIAHLLQQAAEAQRPQPG